MVSTKRLRDRIGGTYRVKGIAEKATAKNNCSIVRLIGWLYVKLCFLCSKPKQWSRWLRGEGEGEGESLYSILCDDDLVSRF